MQAGANEVLPGFFATMGVALLAGRDFTERDVLGAAPKVVVVNETFATRFFGSPAEAVGGRTGWNLDKPFEIVGVIQDHKATDLKEAPWARTYFPLGRMGDSLGQVVFYLRTNSDPGPLTAAAQQAVREIDPGLAVYGVKTVARQMDETHYIERLFARLSATFAALAMLIAAVGLYGVAAFSVARRTREIGIRIALGARPNGIFTLVLREALTLVAIGVLIGVPLAFVLGRLVESQLFGVSAINLGVSGAGICALVAASVLAGYLPARRAMQIFPVQALRSE